MEECRFEHGDCVIHSPTGGPTTHRGPPALCSHAAADLERRVEEAEHTCRKWEEDFERFNEMRLSLESRLVRLELEAQTYAEVAAGFQQEKARLEEARAMAEALVLSHEGHIARLEEEKATLVQTIEATQAHRKVAPHGDCACQVCDLTRCLAQSEAREAAMHAALTASTRALDNWLNTYAPEFCNQQRVAEAHQEIANSGGTIGYITQLQQANRTALSHDAGRA